MPSSVTKTETPTPDRIASLGSEIPETFERVEIMMDQMLSDILLFHKQSKSSATSKGRRKSQRRSKMFKSHKRRPQVCSESLDIKDGTVVSRKDRMAERMDEETAHLLLSRLSGHIAFQDAQAGGFDSILKEMQVQEYSEGQTILSPGDGNDWLQVLETGMVEVRGEDSRLLRPGDVFGETAILYGSKVEYAYVAIESCKVWKLHRHHFRKLMAESASNHHRKLARFIKSVPLLRPLSQEAIVRISRALQHRLFAPDEVIMKQNDPPDNFYMIHSGTVRVSKFDSEGKDIFLCNLGPGAFFGELAFLKDEPRAATVTANENMECYFLGKDEFKKIIGSLKDVVEEQSLMGLIQRCKDTLEQASEEQLHDMVSVSHTKSLKRSEYIYKEGDSVDSFFIIRTGQVKVTQWSRTMQEEVELQSLPSGQHFGEGEILKNEQTRYNSGEVIITNLEKRRLVSVVCDSDVAEVLEMSKSDFMRLLRPYFVKQTQRRASISMDPAFFQPQRRQETNFPADRLHMVHSLGMSELMFEDFFGNGDFGAFKSVRLKSQPETLFTLKCLQKTKLIEAGRKHSALREKQALANLDCPYVAKIHATLNDQNQIYLVLDFVGGGDAWAALYDVWTEGIEKNDFGGLSTPIVVQWTAMVTVALEHLHQNGIMYRDLRPENILVAHDGSLKLSDFSLSKLVPYKTEDGESTDQSFTLCGCPEYFAPEVILNRGHSFAVDFWALGVLFYELFCAVTPFEVDDSPMETLDHIVNCQSYLAFPPGFDVNARGLIRRLLNPVPGLRFGVLKSGFADIREHILYSENSLNWEAIESGEFHRFYLPADNVRPYPGLDEEEETVSVYKSLSLSQNQEWFGEF